VSRAAYKLLEIQDKHKIIKAGETGCLGRPKARQSPGKGCWSYTSELRPFPHFMDAHSCPCQLHSQHTVTRATAGSRAAAVTIFQIASRAAAAAVAAAGGTVLDLGCSPGAWMQVACQQLGPPERGGTVLGVDIQVTGLTGLLIELAALAAAGLCAWGGRMRVPGDPHVDHACRPERGGVRQLQDTPYAVPYHYGRGSPRLHMWSDGRTPPLAGSRRRRRLLFRNQPPHGDPNGRLGIRPGTAAATLPHPTGPVTRHPAAPLRKTYRYYGSLPGSPSAHSSGTSWPAAAARDHPGQVLR
jgi:hypothetical protein